MRSIQQRRHDSDLGLPYPFFLAHPLQADPETLGDPSHWLIEWKWDGIPRATGQACGTMWLWSRGEDLITDRFLKSPRWARRCPTAS